MNQGESEPANTVTIVLDNSGWVWYAGAQSEDLRMSNQMKRWVVSYINWMEYNLTSAIVYAPDWFSVVHGHLDGASGADAARRTNQ